MNGQPLTLLQLAAIGLKNTLKHNNMKTLISLPIGVRIAAIVGALSILAFILCFVIFGAHYGI